MLKGLRESVVNNMKCPTQKKGLLIFFFKKTMCDNVQYL